jgi:hypothetical protein
MQNLFKKINGPNPFINTQKYETNFLIDMKGKYLCLQTNTKLNTADKVRNKIKTPAKSARLGVGDFSVLH